MVLEVILCLFLSIICAIHVVVVVLFNILFVILNMFIFGRSDESEPDDQPDTVEKDALLLAQAFANQEKVGS